MASGRRFRRRAPSLLGQSGNGSEAARVLIAGGAVLLFVSLVVGKLLFGVVFKWLMLIGVLMAGVGAVLLWMRADEQHAPARFAEPGEQRAQGFGQGPLPVVDRTVTELFHELDRVATGMTQQERPRQWGPEVFDVIEWRRFEAVVQRLYEQAGYDAKSQSHGADKGVDIWLYPTKNAQLPPLVVQCKHWSGKPVGVDKLRELRGVMAAHSVRRGLFATSSSFTREASDFGNANDIDLLDRDGLLALVAQRNASQQTDLLNIALEGDYWRPTCVNCGTKMVERLPKKQGNAFWGCKHFPRCKTTLPMRIR